MTKQNQLDTARHELAAIDETLRHLYSNGTEAHRLFHQAQKTAVIRLQLNSDGTPLNTTNAGSYVLGELRGAAFADLDKLAAVVAALESSDDWREAKSLCQPLVDRIRKLEAEIADERRAEDHRLQALAEAKQKAMAEAAAKVEARFATA